MMQDDGCDSLSVSSSSAVHFFWTMMKILRVVYVIQHKDDEEHVKKIEIFILSS